MTRYFRNAGGRVYAFSDDQLTCSQKAELIESLNTDLLSTSHYSDLKEAVEALDINTINVEAAQSALDSSTFAHDFEHAKSTYDLEQSDDNQAALDLAKAAYETCDEYIALEQYQIAVQRVESAKLSYESCDEYIELERLKSTRIWIPEDAVEMTDDEIYAHLNPQISNKPVILPTIDEQVLVANAECTKRINQHWSQIGQINASLGVYGEEDTAACATWITSNREALIELLNRDDLTEIDVTEDQYWPVFK